MTGQGGGPVPFWEAERFLLGHPSTSAWTLWEFPYTVKGNQIARQLTVKQAERGSLGGPRAITGS